MSCCGATVTKVSGNALPVWTDRKAYSATRRIAMYLDASRRVQCELTLRVERRIRFLPTSKLFKYFHFSTAFSAMVSVVANSVKGGGARGHRPHLFHKILCLTIVTCPYPQL